MPIIKDLYNLAKSKVTRYNTELNPLRGSSIYSNLTGKLPSTIMGEKNFNRAARNVKTLIKAGKTKEAAEYVGEQNRKIDQQKRAARYK